MRKREGEAIVRVLQRFADGDYTAIDRKNISADNVGVLEKIRGNIETSERELRKQKIKNGTDAAGVAHDLKTPLAIMRGAAECVKDGMDDKDYCGIIIEKADAMSAVIDSYIDAARQTAGEIGDYKETVNAKEFFSAEFARSKLMTDGFGMKMKIGRIPPNVSVVIDRKRMARVVQNLISNAVKYGKRGMKLTVRFSVQRGKFVIAIKDRGQGISAENLPHIFDRFFMEDAARSNSGTSSGLGLFVAKEIVEEHGGNIKVKSKKGKGSTFYIILPTKANEKKTATERFDAYPRVFKLLIETCFGFVYGCVYRFVRFGETHYAGTLAGAFISLFLLPFIWIIDIISIIFYGRITFLAD